MGALWRKLLYLLRRRQFERELEEEMRLHLEMKAATHREAGLSADEALHAARRQFGNPTLLKESSREMWGWRSLAALAGDVKYALRMLWSNPGFTAIAVLTLALGVGVLTSIFSMVDSLLLRPLPFPDSDRLVSLYYRTTDGLIYNSMSYPDYEYFRDHNDFLSSLAAYDDVTAGFRFGDQIEKVAGEVVSWNYFRVLGVEPAVGRAFLPEEDRVPGANPVVVLGYGLWQRRFAGGPAVIGRSIVINGSAFTVIGVAPRGFRGFALDRSAPPEFWAPLMMYPAVIPNMAGLGLERRWSTHWLASLGRLKPGVTLNQAQARMSRLTLRLKQEHWDREWKGVLETKAGLLYRLNDSRFSPRQRASVVNTLWMLLAIAALVLLASSFNVANLLLVRAAKRTKEMAVRLSLGAGRGRLIRQLLTESVLLSLFGAAAAMVVALATSRFLESFRQPFKMPMLLETGLDLRMLGFAMLISGVTGIFFGLAPARMASRLDLNSALKVETIAAGFGFRGARLKRWLIAGQVAVSMLLLIGAGLFVRTLINAQAADITVDPGNVLLFRRDIRGRGYDEERGKVLYSELLHRVQGVPGVRGAALVLIVPLGGMRGGTDVVIPEKRRPIQVDFNVVSPEYFRTVGIPIGRGREFNTDDREGSPGVAIVNEQWARHFWPGEEPIGRRFQSTNPARVVEVVGVVRDGPFRNHRADIRPCFYLPFAQCYQKQMSLEVRTAMAPLSMLPAIRHEIDAVDKDFAEEADVLTLKSHRDAGLAQERLTAGLLSALGLLALALAAIGIYCVVSFSAVQRTREIGLRMAVGASARDIAVTVLSDGLRPALAGAMIGVAAALMLTRFVAGLVFGITATDPLTYAGAAALLIAIALVACYLPARRATKVDPMMALRYE